MPSPSKELSINERWEQGVDHDPRSVALYESIAKIDFEDCSDSFGFKSGGDGDNGEALMYILDVHFERLDKSKIRRIKTEGTSEEMMAAIAAIAKIK